MQNTNLTKNKTHINYLAIISVICLLLYLVLSLFIKTIQNDFYDFKSWGDTFLEVGPYGFYSNAIGHPTDYPPVYLFICGLMSALCNLFHANEMWQKFFFRLPSALILFASIFVFYKLLKHFISSEKKTIILTVLYALAPASIFNIIWAQCDCFTLFYILFACLMFVDKKYFLVLLTCVVGVLTKTQFFFLIPVFGFAVFWRSIKEKRLKKFFIDLAVCILIYFAIYFPFLLEKMQQGEFFYLFKILLKQVEHYNMYSVNAFNIYMCFGIGHKFYPNWFAIVNFAIILLIVVLCCVLIAKNDSDINVVLLSAFILTAIFMLSTNMHERYMHGALGTTMIAAYVLNNKKLITANWFFYLVQFINAYYAWFVFKNFKCENMVVPITLSILSVIAFIVMIIETIKLTFKKKVKTEKIES